MLERVTFADQNTEMLDRRRDGYTLGVGMAPRLWFYSIIVLSSKLKNIINESSDFVTSAAIILKMSLV